MKAALRISALIFAMGLVSTADAQERAHTTPAAQPTAAPTAPDPADASQAQGDSLALGLLGAINEHEIAAGKQAEAKRVAGPVLEYARMMQKAHGENQKQTLTLGTLSNGADVQAMKSKGQSELKALDAKTGSDYARSYIDAMVKGHTEALTALDQKLLPSAKSAAVKEHLTKTRGHVVAHLEKAKSIRSEL